MKTIALADARGAGTAIADLAATLTAGGVVCGERRGWRARTWGCFATAVGRRRAHAGAPGEYPGCSCDTGRPAPASADFPAQNTPRTRALPRLGLRSAPASARSSRRRATSAVTFRARVATSRTSSSSRSLPRAESGSFISVCASSAERSPARRTSWRAIIRRVWGSSSSSGGDTPCTIGTSRARGRGRRPQILEPG
jgi:hypothetical protein